MSTKQQTRRELNLAIFEGTTDRVLWQPRLDQWIEQHRQENTLPDRLKGKADFEIYDTLRCSIRYAIDSGLQYSAVPDVETSEQVRIDREHVAVITHTPEGDLRTVHAQIWEGGAVVNQRIAEFAVKTVQDLRVLTAMIRRRRIGIDPEKYIKSEAKLGTRGEPTIFLQSDGFTDLIKTWSGLENACYLLADHPAEMDAYIEACWETDDRLMEVVFQVPCRVFNLGDHTTNEFTPPPILERYCLPRWQKISALMRKNNRFVHSHWDGHSRQILKYLKPSGLQAVEALTAAPMGDMTLEMIKEAVGNELVVLDMIPAIFFLPNYPMKDLMDFTRRVIDMFAPRLILGISDEMPPYGDIARVEAVGELVDRICGLAE